MGLLQHNVRLPHIALRILRHDEWPIQIYSLHDILPSTLAICRRLSGRTRRTVPRTRQDSRHEFRMEVVNHPRMAHRHSSVRLWSNSRRSCANMICAGFSSPWQQPTFSTRFHPHSLASLHGSLTSGLSCWASALLRSQLSNMRLRFGTRTAPSSSGP